MTRNRHPLAIALYFTAACAMTSVLHAADTPHTLPFTVSKETMAITEPLDANGAPDYVAAIQALTDKNAPGPANNGFTLFMSNYDAKQEGSEKLLKPLAERVGATITFGSPGKLMQYTRYLRDVKNKTGATLDEGRTLMNRLSTEPWSEEDHPDFSEYLKAMGPSLDEVVKAAEKPAWWQPYMTPREKSMMTILLLYIGSERDAARSLCARAMNEVKKGDVGAFVTDVHAVRQLARKIGKGTLIEHLVGCSIDQSALRAVGAAAAMGTPTSAQLDAIQKGVLDGFPAMPGLAESVNTWERYSMLDYVTQLAMQNPAFLNVTYVTTYKDGLTLAHIHWDDLLKRANHVTDEQLAILSTGDAISRRSAWKAFADKADAMKKRLPELAMAEEARQSGRESPGIQLLQNAGESDAAYTERVGDVIFCTLEPDLSKVDLSQYRAVFTEKLTGLAMQIARYKMANGKLPEKLKMLVPHYLKEVPADPYSEGGKQPLLYAINKKSFVVYSVGANGSDDGGSSDSQNGFDDVAVGIIDRDAP